jgi:hypothetical protein
VFRRGVGVLIVQAWSRAQHIQMPDRTLNSGAQKCHLRKASTFFSREAGWKQTKKILLILDTAFTAAHNVAYSHMVRRKSKERGESRERNMNLLRLSDQELKLIVSGLLYIVEDLNKDDPDNERELAEELLKRLVELLAGRS